MDGDRTGPSRQILRHRSAMAETIEANDYTSAQQRAHSLRLDLNAPSELENETAVVSKAIARSLSAAPISERLGIDANIWCELTRDFGKLFSTVAGKPRVIESTRSRTRHQRYKIRNRAKELLPS